jgi:hypothetical protein
VEKVGLCLKKKNKNKMKYIPSIFILIIVICYFTNCSQSNNSIDTEKCNCDSIKIENHILYKKYSCFFNNKKITVKKNLTGDTVEIKKYYLTNEGIYQKFEYLILLKNRIDYNQSAFVDINLDKKYAEITLSSNNSSQNIFILLDKYSLSRKGNYIKVPLDSLKTINLIQKQTDKIVNNDSIKSITEIVDYFYVYKDIMEERTLMNQYNKLIQCKVIK